jgi:hypothetical protein
MKKGSGIKINAAKVTRAAASGLTIEKIAQLVGTSRPNFIRLKRLHPELKAAYEAGVRQYAEKAGLTIKQSEKGGFRAIASESAPRDEGARRDMVLRHLTTHPERNSFSDIRTATGLPSGAVSAAMVELMLEMGVVSARRDAEDNFRYFITPSWSRVQSPPQSNPQNGIKPNQHQSERVPHSKAQWQAAY